MCSLSRFNLSQSFNQDKSQGHDRQRDCQGLTGQSNSPPNSSANSPRVILITGASSGIGYETALAFARLGDKVAATARRADRLEQLLTAAKGLPGEVRTYTADVTRAEDMQRVVDDLMAQWG